MTFQRINGIKHYIFDSIEEFQHYFVSRGLEVPTLVMDWRDGKQGEWVLADDGGVVQLLKRGSLKTGGHWCRTVVGTFKQMESYEMDTDPTLHPNRYTFSQKDTHRVERVKQRKNLTKKEGIFVLNLLNGMSIKDAYINAFGYSKVWEQNAHLLIRQERVMNEIRKAAKSAAGKLNLNVEFIMKKLMELTEDGIMDSVRLQALKELRDWLEAIEVSENNNLYSIEQSPLKAIDPGDYEKEKREALKAGYIGEIGEND